MLSAQVIDEIRIQVRSGFYEKDQPGELPQDELSDAINHEIQELELEKASWPLETDCDRLNRVFEALNQRGIISLQNAGLTQDDGYAEIEEAYVDVDDEEKIIGYCFYHRQDLEHAVRGTGLYLAFGPSETEKEKTQGPIIGRIICEELQRNGFEVKWDGTFKERIFLPKICWLRKAQAE